MRIINTKFSITVTYLLSGVEQAGWGGEPGGGDSVASATS